MESNPIKITLDIKGIRIPPRICKIMVEAWDEWGELDPAILEVKLKEELKMFEGKPLSNVSKKMIIGKIKRVVDEY